jgi:tetratricopeptide (TPR) repeat protein
MHARMIRVSTVALCSIASSAGALVCALALAPPVSPGLEALDYAFRFASAIASDPKDRAKAQELAIGEYLAIGAVDEALRRAEAIEGWRRGLVYADLAAILARQGRSDEARGLVARAEEIRAAAAGWEGSRIAAHVAQALAMLGETERLGGIASDLAQGDPLQYAGRAAATLATGDAVRGDFDQAMRRMASLEESDDLEGLWWRTAGFLAVARQDTLPRARRLRALDAARRSAEGLPGWKRAEALGRIAEEFARLDRPGRARESLRAAEAIVMPIESGHSEKAALLANLARAWARAGERERALDLLGQAEPLVAGALNIDQPGIYANIASGHRQIGGTTGAGRLYARALEAAAALRNARPRALAVTAVCRQMGRHGVGLDGATRGRLDALLIGLGDPW